MQQRGDTGFAVAQTAQQRARNQHTQKAREDGEENARRHDCYAQDVEACQKKTGPIKQYNSYAQEVQQDRAKKHDGASEKVWK